MTDVKSTEINDTINSSDNTTTILREYEMDIKDDPWNIYRVRPLIFALNANRI